ncbi:hypothetical protein B9Z55_026865 [Caenorhabditis nigoni]|nr:hypothetical protein B9Z55_026865 [Caenorhabditis nigoni]
MKELVRGASLKPLYIKYRLDPSPYVSVLVCFEQQEEMLAIALKKPQLLTNGITMVKIADLQFQGRYQKTDDGALYLQYLEPNREDDSVLISLQDHVDALFPNVSRISLTCMHPSVIPRSRQIRNVTDILLTSHPITTDLSTDHIEHLLAIHRNTKSFYANGQISAVELLDSSPFLHLDMFSCWAAGNVFFLVLRKFTGRWLHLIYCINNVDTCPLEELLETWRTRRTHENLRGVRLSLGHQVNVPELIYRFNLQKWNPARRPRYYTNVPKINHVEYGDMFDKSGKMDTSEFYDIQQIDTGKWASIHIAQSTNGTAAKFCVWDL